MPIEIPHKISYPYIERCVFHSQVKLSELLDLRARKCFWNCVAFTWKYGCKQVIILYMLGQLKCCKLDIETIISVTWIFKRFQFLALKTPRWVPINRGGMAGSSVLVGKHSYVSEASFHTHDQICLWYLCLILINSVSNFLSLINLNLTIIKRFYAGSEAR